MQRKKAVLRTDGLNGALYCTAMDLRLHFYYETAFTFARNSVLLLLLLLVLIILQCTMTIVWPYHGEKKVYYVYLQPELSIYFN